MDINYYLLYLVITILLWFGGWTVRYETKWIAKKFGLKNAGGLFMASPYAVPIIWTGLTPVYYIWFKNGVRDINFEGIVVFIYIIILLFVGVKVSNYLIKKGFYQK